MSLNLVATCALGLEELLASELAALAVADVEVQRGAVSFRGTWADCWRANWRLRTANRVLVALDSWPGEDGDALAAGARRLVNSGRSWDGLDTATLCHPQRTFALHATSTASQVRDARWAALRVKDGWVDGQRDRFGQRASVERQQPDLELRLWLHGDHATLLLDTSGEPLDRRGYRLRTTDAPVREQLAAACVLASGWDGQGPVVDPMCGSGTLLIEAAWIALGRAPGHLRRSWAFERLPGFDREAFRAIRREPLPAPGPGVQLWGVDRNRAALAAARANLGQAGLTERCHLLQHDAFDFLPPPGPGLVVVNPAYGERLAAEPDQWRRLGDLFKQRFAGWRAVVLTADPSRGKWIGLRPRRKLPVRNGPLDARILLFDLY